MSDSISQTPSQDPFSELKPHHKHIPIGVVMPNDLSVTMYVPDHLKSNWIARTPTGVRITHLPSGLFAISDKERSQHKNRLEAMEKLKCVITLHNERVRQAKEQATKLPDPFPLSVHPAATRVLIRSLAGALHQLLSNTHYQECEFRSAPINECPYCYIRRLKQARAVLKEARNYFDFRI